MSTAEPTPRHALLLLAAGAGRRYGADKLMAPLRQGGVLLEASLQPLTPWKQDVHVMLRPGASEAWRLVEQWGGHPHWSPDAALGMGHTLAAGIALLEGYTGCLLLLGDMPGIRRQSIATLLARLDEHALVVPRHAGQWGHPVGFGRQYFAPLRQLTGDRGAHGLLEQHRAQITFVDLDDPGILFDVDTAADLDRFQSP